jgi:hypothetical protein
LFVLLLASCKAKLGESCDSDDGCEAGYVCFRGKCQTSKTRETTLNDQSGVGNNVPLERPTAGGERVKVRVTNGEGEIFAACLPTERLIGGGCSGGSNCNADMDCGYIRSYPAKFSADDTLGARWTCVGAMGTLQAYALCQATTPSTATAPGSGSN